MIASIRRITVYLAVLAAGVIAHGTLLADTIAVIGTGNVAGALGAGIRRSGA